MRRLVQINDNLPARTDLIDYLKTKDGTFVNINEIIISTLPFSEVFINNNSFKVGSTGILTFSDVEITKLVFQNDLDLRTYIDCFVI